MALAGTTAASLAVLVFATGIPSVVLADGGGSDALAELLARSPGARIGSVALKAKTPRMAIAPAAGEEPGRGTGLPGNPIASVLGSSPGPEGPVPGTLPGGFPSDFVAPGPNPLESVPGSPTASGAPTFDNISFPGVGGVPIFVPGTGGGGGGGGTVPGPDEPETPTPETPPTELPPPPVVPPVVTPVPEPATWFMLIVGFGAIGGAMRQRRRAAFV